VIAGCFDVGDLNARAVLGQVVRFADAIAVREQPDLRQAAVDEG
jgi:hypothetical protein